MGKTMASHFHSMIILIAFTLIYTGLCVHSNQNPDVFLRDDGVLTVKLVRLYGFILQWEEASFGGTDNYNVEVTENCKITDFQCSDTTCIVDTDNFPDCKLIKDAGPCDTITATVTRTGAPQQSITFNLAPKITIDTIKPKMSFNGNIVSITWEGADSTNVKVNCATLVRTNLLNYDNMWVPIDPYPIELDSSNTYQWPALKDCKHGDVMGRIVYFTPVGGYETDIVIDTVAYYKGLGVTKVTATPKEDKACSVDVSWDADCSSDVNHYKVAWPETSKDVNGKNTIIENLDAGSVDVTVQAYGSNDETEPMGETKSNSVDVPEVDPAKPKDVTVVGSDANPHKLSVTWSKPALSCTRAITGYTVYYRKTDDSDDTTVEVDGADASSKNLTGLDVCTEYKVAVATKWNGGSEKSDLKTKKTGSKDPSKPTLSAESISSSEIKLTWESVDTTLSCPLKQYTVNWSPPDKDGNGGDDAGKETEYTITGLQCNKIYTITVTANTDGGKSSNSDNLEQKIDDEAIGQPTVTVVSSNETPTKLTASWNHPPYPCYGGRRPYKVSWQAEGDANPTDPIDEPGTSHVIDKLIPCTKYTVSVVAFSTTLIPGPPGTGSAITTVDAPGKPDASLDAGSSTTSSLYVSWEQETANNCSITKYQVSWTPADETDGNSGDIGSKETNYTIDGLKCNTDYSATVTAYTSDTKSSESDVVPGTTDDEAPGQTTVSVLPVDEDSTKLGVSWTVPTPTYECTGGLGNYSVSWKITGTDDTIDTQNVTDIFTIIDGLEPCVEYTVNVAARSNTGLLGENGTRDATTAIEAPGKPDASLDAGSNATSSLMVSWEQETANNCNIKKYQVSWTSEDDTGGDSDDIGSEETSYTIKGLKCNTNYDATVTAYTSDTKQNVSDAVPGTTDDEAPGQTTVSVSPVDGDSTKLSVSWPVPTPTYECTGGLGNYSVSWKVTGTDDTIDTQNVTDIFTTIDGLEPCVEYTVNVVARSNTGLLGENGTGDATTAIEAPGKPDASLTAGSSTTSSLFVSWEQETANNCNITKYQVSWTQADDTDGNSGDIGSEKTNYTIDGLKCNTDYSATVTAYTSDTKSSVSDAVPGTTNDEAPGKPIVYVSAVEEHSTQLSASWNATTYNCSGDLGSYSVSWRAVGDEDDTSPLIVDDNSLLIGIGDLALEPCTTYIVSVAASSNTSKNGEPGTGNASTAVEVPGKSTNIKDNGVTSESINVTWSKPTNNPCPITNYTVEWKKSSGEEKQDATVDGSVTFYNIPGLEACINYTITVIASTKKGQGDPSDPVIERSGTDAPPVDGVEITSESRHAQVSWKRPETVCPLTFIVNHSGTTLWTNNQTTDAGSKQTIEDPSVTAELDNLLPYSQYNVCVTVETGDTTCNTTITEDEAPSEPLNVICEGLTDVSVTVSWQYPAEENGILTHYDVFWRLGDGDPNNYTVNANITSYTIPDLNEGNYSFTVSASNTKGSSSQSKPSYLMMNGPNPPPGCDGGCIAGIIVGVLLVALAIPAFIYRHKIIDKLKTDKPPVQTESPYELKGAAILKTGFRKHVEELEIDGATMAYQYINDESPQKTKFAASKPFNKGKNRWANIHPFDDTRVKLDMLSNGSKGSDYINANHITFPDTYPVKFIATQGPVDSTIGDFWRMVWENGVHDVIMLCNLIETGKSKCAQYWTESGERAMEFGEFTVYCQNVEEDRSKSITRYIDIAKNGQHRMVKQHHYVTWPDHGVPDNEDDLLQFLASVKGKYNPHAKNVVVHCSAGVGRTGTFIGLWVLTSLLEENRSAKSIDVHKIALMMRDGRCDMIQNKGQYLYLHKCLLRFMEDIENQDFALINVDEEPIYGNVGGNANKGYQKTEKRY